MTTENMKLSRRGFLGLGAAATAAAAAAGLAGCAPKTMAETGPAEPEGYTWETAPEPITEVDATEETDVVVIGGGATGAGAGGAAGRKGGEAGVRGLGFPTQGGGVLARGPATAEVLPEIAEAVNGRCKILVDGGIRTGVDVFKALALGADAVLIARPFVNAIYGAGAEGVQVYVDKLAGELADTMSMCGAHSLAEITRNMVRV